MTRSSVQVSVRTRPSDCFAVDLIKVDEKFSSIEVRRKITTQENAATSGNHDNQPNSYAFRFHSILHNNDQSYVYEASAKSIVTSFLDGVNGTIMCYGQTGSGKTYTMIGDAMNYNSRGIIPRALGQIFSQINMKSDIDYSVEISYAEIYNERIFDLLADPESERKEITILEDSDGKGVNVRGLASFKIKSELESLNLLYKAELMRITARHNLNRCSNRSHCVLSINLKQFPKSGVSGKVVSSKLNLVDLAGSERLKKSLNAEHCDAKALSDMVIKKESMYINQSLSYLEQCVVALSKNSSHVPYRQTKLTTLLRDSLGGNCNTMLIACIWGDENHLEETISTLRLASRMMRVQNEVHTIETCDTTRLLINQQRLIQELRQELHMHNALIGRRNVAYEQLTAEHQETLRAQVMSYIDAIGPQEENSSLPQFESIRQMKEICRIFKSMIVDARQNLSRGLQTGPSLLGLNNASRSTLRLNPSGGQLQVADVEERIGRVDETKVFSLGRAPDHAAPNNWEEIVRREAREIQSTGFGCGREIPLPIALDEKTILQANESFELREQPSEEGSIVSIDTVSRDQLFRMFLERVGDKKRSTVEEAHRALQQLKKEVLSLSKAVNAAKREIDKVKEKRPASTKNSSGHSEIVSEVDHNLVQLLKEKKQVYRDRLHRLEEVKSELNRVQKEYNEVKTWAIGEFDQWVRSQLSSSESIFNDETGSKEDDDELFEIVRASKLGEKDPNAIPFYTAMRNAIATKRQKSVALRRLHISKRRK